MKKKDRVNGVFIFAIILVAAFLSRAESQDTTKINELIFLGDSLLYTMPEQSLAYAREATKLSKQINNYQKIKISTQLLSDAFWYTDQFDSTDYYNILRIKYAEEADDKATLGDLYTEYAVELNRISKYDEALRDLRKAHQYYLEIDNQIDNAFVINKIGLVYHNMNQLDSSMVYLKSALDMYQVLNLQNKQGMVIESMAIIQKQLGDYDKSIELHQESRALFQEARDTIGLMSNANNLGIVFKTIDKPEKALAEYQKVYDFANIMDHKGGLMSYFINSGILLNKLKRHIEAESLLRNGIKIAEELRSQISIADSKSSLARSLLHQNKFSEAIIEVNESIQIAHDIGALEKEQDAHEVAKEIYLAQGNADEALLHMESYQSLKDSIFQLARTKQVNELQTQYETEKKDAEIVLLNKNIEIENVKRQRLWGGLGLIVLSGLALIYGIIQRNKKMQAVLSKDKAIAIERQERAEQQLEFKKKELTAKALQLAKKNEFLLELETEIVELQSSVDASVGKASSRISRMIQRDIVDDEEWDQFATEFSSVHQEFLDRLRERFGTFSKGEMRLIYLLRMNMTSKEIANILRISGEGIRKARYRLRKKMSLDSSDDLQGIILGM